VISEKRRSTFANPKPVARMETYTPFSTQTISIWCRNGRGASCSYPPSPACVTWKKNLELGCGTGLWIGEFVKWGVRPENLTGTNLQMDSLILAHSYHSEKVGFVCGNGAYLPFPPDTFDSILISTVFNYILGRKFPARVR